LFRHGFRRFTEDVDLLVRPESLKRIHKELDGLGYLPPHAASRNLRDIQLGVRIEFVVTGQFPGDGKPKPVAFPDPVAVSTELDHLRYLNLGPLVELKLASGMSSVGRLRDLADVIELIKSLKLSENFAEQLNPFVRDKFRELWRQARTRFVLRFSEGAPLWDEMQSAGVVLEPGDDPLLVTSDPDVAARFGMIEESEYWTEADRGLDDGNPVAGAEQ